MGCCLNQMPSPYALAYKDKKNYHSILLKENRVPSPKKSVRFSFSYTNYNSLTITEEPDVHHFDFIFNPVSAWTIHENTENIDIKYSTDEQKFKMQLLFHFDRLIEHEVIVSLINNPRYRILWDRETRKMELIYGDTYLDATISLIDYHGESKLWTRKVRKCNGNLFITYMQFNDQSKDNYLTITILDHKQVIITSVNDFENDYDKSINRQIEWAKSLYYEIITNQSPI